MVTVHADSQVTLALLVCPVSAANKTALHYDKNLFTVNSLHMEDNQPHWDLCQPECETSEEYTHKHAHTNTHATAFAATDTHTKGEWEKVNLEANRDWSFYSDICLVPETDGEPIRPPGASSTLRLPCHPAAPPQNLQRGTHDRWHLANVTLPLP